MMVRIRFLFIFLVVSNSAYCRKDFRSFFKNADVFFQTYVKEGRVDYLSIKKNPEALNVLVDNISSINTSLLRGKKLKAYLINVYNIFVVDQVIRNFPLISPYEARGFFTNRNFNLGGSSVSLNEIKEMLLSKYSDIRIYGLICDGSLGSPNLEDHSYRSFRLNRKLKQHFKNISSDRNFVRPVPKASLLLFSDIFRGYENYFGKEEMIKLINKSRKEKLTIQVATKFFPGNCNLNIKL